MEGWNWNLGILKARGCSGDLVAHPSLGAQQGQAPAGPSRLLPSTRQGGTWGKSLKEQLTVTTFKPQQAPDVGEPRRRDSKGWSSKLGCAGSPQAGTAIPASPGSSREALETLRHSSNLAEAEAEPSHWPQLLE